MAYELPSLQKKIDEFNELFELDDDWNVRYVVDEDDYGDSILIHLYDYSETLDSDEFYGVGAYGELFPRWFERFEKAVREDTGDDEFYLEPYSYSGHFIGRAYLKGQKRWSSMKNAMKNRRFSMKKKAGLGKLTFYNHFDTEVEVEVDIDNYIDEYPEDFDCESGDEVMALVEAGELDEDEIVEAIRRALESDVRTETYINDSVGCESYMFGIAGMSAGEFMDDWEVSNW